MVVPSFDNAIDPDAGTGDSSYSAVSSQEDSLLFLLLLHSYTDIVPFPETTIFWPSPSIAVCFAKLPSILWPLWIDVPCRFQNPPMVPPKEFTSTKIWTDPLADSDGNEIANILPSSDSMMFGAVVINASSKFVVVVTLSSTSTSTAKIVSPYCFHSLLRFILSKTINRRGFSVQIAIRFPCRETAIAVMIVSVPVSRCDCFVQLSPLCSYNSITPSRPLSVVPAMTSSSLHTPVIIAWVTFVCEITGETSRHNGSSFPFLLLVTATATSRIAATINAVTAAA